MCIKTKWDNQRLNKKLFMSGDVLPNKFCTKFFKILFYSCGGVSDLWARQDDPVTWDSHPPGPCHSCVSLHKGRIQNVPRFSRTFTEPPRLFMVCLLPDTKPPPGWLQPQFFLYFLQADPPLGPELFFVFSPGGNGWGVRNICSSIVLNNFSPLTYYKIVI